MLENFIDKDDCYLGYHYASVDTFNSIMQSHVLRFTRADCFNDKTEGKYILDLFKKTVKNIVNKSNKKVYDYLMGINELGKYSAYADTKDSYKIDKSYTFICCFSKNNNSRYQWQHYIKSKDKKGFSIGIDLNQYKSEGWQLPDSQLFCRIKIYEVIYGKKQQKALLKKIIENFLEKIKDVKNLENPFNKGWLLGELEDLQYVFKRKKYKKEQEIRLLRRVCDSDEQFETKYDTNNNYHSYIEETFNWCSNIKITTSPKNKMTETEINCLANWLKENNYSNFSINDKNF